MHTLLILRLIGTFQLEGILRIVGFTNAPVEPSNTVHSLGANPTVTHLLLQRVDLAVMYVMLDVLSQQKLAVQAI
jgi:hypothetical protein